MKTPATNKYGQQEVPNTFFADEYEGCLYCDTEGYCSCPPLTAELVIARRKAKNKTKRDQS